MAGAALLRSVLNQFLRATPSTVRHSALGIHGRRQWPGHPFSSLTKGSRPPAAETNKDHITWYKKVLCGLGSATVAAAQNPTNIAYLLFFGTAVYMYGWMRPAFKEIMDDHDSAVKDLSKATKDLSKATEVLREKMLREHNSEYRQVDKRNGGNDHE